MYNKCFFGLLTEQSLKEKAKLMDVSKYLKWLKLDLYIKLFEDEEVDGSLLWEMRYKDLTDLGIGNSFHCRKIENRLTKYLRTQ